MLAAFQEHLKVTFPHLIKQPLLIAISGGLDSVVLTHLLHQLGYNIALAHCNFNLRVGESDGDEQFIKQLAHDLQLELHLAHFETAAYAQQKGVSIQMAARELRYDFFSQVCKTNSYDYVLTAHHLDDQLETFLINLNRGSGLQGLQGIPQVNDLILRPLLPFSREQIKNFAIHNAIKWREDSSNSSHKYQRNELRNLVLPLVHQALPQLKAHFTQTLDYLKGSQDMVGDAVLRFRESGITTTHTGINIHIEQLMQTSNPAAYLYELIKEYGFQNLSDVMDLVHGITGKRIESATYMVYKDRDYLVVCERLTIQPLYLSIDNITCSYEFYDSTLELENLDIKDALELVKKNKEKNILYIDAAAISFPLTLRSWKHGDRMQPYGMKGTKLVSDMLTDSKVSFIDKEKMVVLTSSQDILWILGLRSSNYGKITATTKSVIKLTYSK